VTDDEAVNIADRWDSRYEPVLEAYHAGRAAAEQDFAVQVERLLTVFRAYEFHPSVINGLLLLLDRDSYGGRYALPARAVGHRIRDLGQ